MTDKEVCECIPVELIRAQIINVYKKIKFYDGIHEDTWSNYPCIVLERNNCRTDHCLGRISLSIRIPPRDIRILSILSIRSEERGFAYLDQHLRSMLENGILHNLQTVIKELNTPVIPSATEYFENPQLPFRSFKKKKK